MRIVVTGSSGRIGRAIFAALSVKHDVVGVDLTPFSTTHFTGDLANSDLLLRALEGAEAVVHVAGLHAPHVGVVPDREFERVNVEGTSILLESARSAGVRRFVMTSTTALYGEAIEDGRCTWVDEQTCPRPVSIYHRTKLAAEALLCDAARRGFQGRVLRMSRCFPEPADAMAIYRLHRGIDVRDVADAHVRALFNDGPLYQCCIVSGATPFRPEDVELLAFDAPALITLRAPHVAKAFGERGWQLPSTIDRIYSSHQAQLYLGWQPRFGAEEIMEQFDRRSLEILPVGAAIVKRAE